MGALGAFTKCQQAVTDGTNFIVQDGCFNYADTNDTPGATTSTCVVCKVGKMTTDGSTPAIGTPNTYCDIANTNTKTVKGYIGAEAATPALKYCGADHHKNAAGDECVADTDALKGCGALTTTKCTMCNPWTASAFPQDSPSDDLKCVAAAAAGGSTSSKLAVAFFALAGLLAF